MPTVSSKQVLIENVSTSSFDWDLQRQSWTATIKNNSSTVLPAGRLYIENSAFAPGQSVETPAVMPWSSTTVRLPLRSKQGDIRSVADLSQTYTLTYNAGSNTAIQKIGGDRMMSLFTDKFRKKPASFLGVKRFNVMLFGLYGAGKSSFINTVMTLMSDGDHVITNAAMVGGGEEHTTTKLRMTRIPDEEGGMTLCDTWGVSDETYKGDELTLLCEGLLANNWDMSQCERIIDFQPHLRKAIASAPSRKQHAVIFMFPYTLFGDANIVDPRIREAKIFFKKFLAMHIQPLVVIAQADVACPLLRQNPMGTFPQTEAMRSVCAKQLGVNLGHIYLAVNYIGETERTYGIDCNTFRILEAVQNRAVEHLVKMMNSADALDYGSDDPDSTASVPSVPIGRPISSPRTTPRPHSAQSVRPSTSRLEDIVNNLPFYSWNVSK